MPAAAPSVSSIRSCKQVLVGDVARDDVTHETAEVERPVRAEHRSNRSCTSAARAAPDLRGCAPGLGQARLELCNSVGTASASIGGGATPEPTLNGAADFVSTTQLLPITVVTEQIDPANPH